MVFVHARKETVKAAMALKEAAMVDGLLDEFSCEDHPSFSAFRREISTSRNREMKELFDNGFGIHHAGMLRTDRNMMERMFEARAIKVGSIPHPMDFIRSPASLQVLCCTATLAWGVNLPAHAGEHYIRHSARGVIIDRMDAQLSSRAPRYTIAPRVPLQICLY